MVIIQLSGKAASWAGVWYLSRLQGDGGSFFMHRMYGKACFLYIGQIAAAGVSFPAKGALDMRYNDTGFVNELSKEMNITEADAEFILMSQGVAGLSRRRRQAHEEADGQALALPGADAGHESGREAGEKLWTANYMLDIAINFLVYVVHYQLMLWSTSYAISAWHVSISTAGLASGIFIVGSLMMRLPAGRYIDLAGRRRMLLWGTSSYFLLMLLYRLCPDVTSFMAVRLLQGMAFGATSTAASIIAASLIPLKRMGSGIGYYTLGVTLASAVGPFWALSFINDGDFGSSLIFCSVLALIILCLSWLIKVPERDLTEREREAYHGFSLGDFIAKSSVAISMIALVGGVCYSTVLSYLGEYAAASGMSELGGRFFFLCFAAASILSRPLIGWLLDNRGGNVVIYPSLLLLAGSMLLVAFADDDYVLLAGGVLLGIGYGSITAACHALALHCSLSRKMGVATSTYFMLLDMGTGAGPYCLGSAVPFFGFSAVYIIAAIIAVLGFGGYFLSMGRFHRFSIERLNRERAIKKRTAINAAHA